MVSQPTVSDRQGSHKHAFAEEPKPQARRGLFRRRRDEFIPDQQARWLLSALRAEVRHLTRPDKAQAASAPRTPAGSHPAYELRRLARTVLDLQDDHTLDYRKCLDRLRAELDGFSKGANAEAAQEAAIERRRREAQRTAGQAAAAIEAAVKVEDITGVKVGLDPEQLGQSVGAVWVNAHDLSEKTLVGLPRITDDMPDPRARSRSRAQGAVGPGGGSVIADGVAAPASPVHPDGGGSAPPMPDEAPAAAEPLPRRVPADPEGAQNGPDGDDTAPGCIGGRRVSDEPAEGGEPR